jgi:hypothetical protein
LGRVGLVFLAALVELVEPAVLWFQLDRVGLVVPEDPVVVAGTWDNFPALALAVSCHRVQFRQDYQEYQAHHRRRVLQPGLWVPVDKCWPVVRESNCIRALVFFAS